MKNSLILAILIVLFMAFLLYLTSNKLTQGVIIEKQFTPAHMCKSHVPDEYTIIIKGVYNNKERIEYNTIDKQTYDSVQVGQPINIKVLK